MRHLLVAVVVCVPVLAAFGALDMQEQSMLDELAAAEYVVAPVVTAVPTPSGAPRYTAPNVQADPPAVPAVTSPAVRGTMAQVAETVPAPPTTLPPVPHYDAWVALAECESGGNWSIDTGNGYFGGLQFALTSWRGAGGRQYADYPHHATAYEQMLTAEVLLDMQGWQAWPTCSRKAGLR